MRHKAETIRRAAAGLHHNAEHTKSRDQIRWRRPQRGSLSAIPQALAIAQAFQCRSVFSRPVFLFLDGDDAMTQL
jgi:hypothetical protein